MSDLPDDMKQWLENHSSLWELNPTKKAHCTKCKWEGTIAKTKRREVSSSPASWRVLAGREGVEYDCPKCGFTVDCYYWKMS